MVSPVWNDRFGPRIAEAADVGDEHPGPRAGGVDVDRSDGVSGGPQLVGQQTVAAAGVQHPGRCRWKR
jgi:hypothetical protein